MPLIQKNTILSLICKKQPERLLFALVGDDRIELPTELMDQLGRGSRIRTYE